jgi:hypothetical protein
MTSTTPNKDLTLPDPLSTNWDVPLNANFEVIDAALGDVTAIDITGIGTTPVVLTAAQYQSLAIKFTGVLSADVTYVIPDNVGGQWVIWNATTSGNFTITLKCAAVGSTSITIERDTIKQVFCDGDDVYFVNDITGSLGASGQVALSDGTSLTSSANFTYSSNVVTITRESAGANTTTNPLVVVQKTSAATPTAGIGAGIEFQTENAASNLVAGGRIQIISTDVTAGSEDYKLAVKLLVGGTMDDVFTVLSSGAAYLSTDGVGNRIITAGQPTATQDLTSAGIVATAANDGNKASGTYTPSPVGGNFKRITCSGSFTLAKPTVSGDYNLVIQMTVSSGTPTVTLSGFSKTAGSSLTSLANGSDYLIYITKVNGFTFANVVALQ